MQTAAQRQAADARLLPFRSRRAWQVAALGASITVLAAGLVLWTAVQTTSEAGPRALNIDFRVFWAAARLAIGGEGLAAFDLARLEAVHGVEPGAWMPWLYPPGYLALIAPLGLMPFAGAFLLATLLAVGLLAWAARSFAAPAPALWLGLVLAPAMIPALLIGQNSLIWLAGLLVGIAALRDGRWLVAGVAFGCLTLKPQLGLMIPLALAAAGLWRVILAAAATAMVLAALPTLIFGPDYWGLLAAGLAAQSDRLIAGIGTLFLMVGPFSLAAQLGVPAPAALTLQAAVSAAAALAVLVLWRSDRVGFDAKAAGLITAILLSAPYLWNYETAFLPAIALFLIRAGLLQPRPWQLVVLFLLWTGAAWQALGLLLGLGGRGLGAVVITPLLLVSLALCLRPLFLAADGPPGRTAAP
jgi:hypothetical protein